MINRTRRASLSLILLLVACIPVAGGSQPPEIAYSQDICDGCGMIIDDARFAAALILETGETRKFDDLAEMFAYTARHPQEEVRAWFAHDYGSEIWVNAASAFYVIGDELPTPMGGGVIAFEAHQSALTFAGERNADVFTFEQVMELRDWD